MKYHLPTRLLAAAIKAEKSFKIACGSAIMAAADKANPAALRKFQMDAYNGGAMRFAWSSVPVVVDLKGMDLTNKSRPVLKDHDTAKAVGHSVSFEKGDTLTLQGVVSGTGPDAQEVVNNSDRGFPWQASIGCDVLETREVAKGESIEVNGQTFDGPLLVVTASRLGEVSFVALGADDSTATRMTARRTTNKLQGTATMTFDEFLASLGIDPATLTDAGRAILQKAFDAQSAAEAAAAAKDEDADEKVTEAKAALVKAMRELGKLEAAAAKTAAGKKGKKALAAAAAVATEDDEDEETPEDIKASRLRMSAEITRTAGIDKLCAAHPEIKAQAISEGWSLMKTENAVLKAGRPTGPAFVRSDKDTTITAQLLTAASCLAGGLTNIEKHFDEKTLTLAAGRFRNFGLNRLILAAAEANGYTGRESLKENHRGILEAAFPARLQAGNFSTLSISGILSNIANKFLLEGFMNVEDTWREVAKIGTLSDFKQSTRYRMTGANQYEKVGPGGQIQHGKFAEEIYTAQLATYALMLAITRTQQINDDLGALTEAPKYLGRGAGLKVNEVFWTKYLDNSAVFTAGRKNLSTGAPASSMTIDGLSKARQLFRKMKDADGKPLGLKPSLVLVPPELEINADVIINSAEMRDTTASTKQGTTNPHRGKYKVVSSAYISDDAMPNYSATAWYMQALPADLPLIEVNFLNGQQSPTIETADADFNTLGIQLRGFHDFGVDWQDYRAGVRSNGA